MKIGQSIKSIREEEKHLDATYVAEQIGISPEEYHNIENGTTDLSISMLEKVADALKCPSAYILNYEKYKEQSVEMHLKEFVCPDKYMNSLNPDYILIRNLYKKLFAYNVLLVDLLIDKKNLLSNILDLKDEQIKMLDRELDLYNKLIEQGVLEEKKPE